MSEKFPKKIPVFPLSGVIYFPKTNLPLNIFENRYLDLVNDSFRNDKLMGMVQEKKGNSLVYRVGCLGKISSFNETDDGRYVIVLNGLSRFNIVEEIDRGKLYREFKINFQEFENDNNKGKLEVSFSDFSLIFKNLKKIFEKQGYIINWDELEKQSLDQTINTLSMASPFSLEEKQVLLESKDLNMRKEKLEEILNTYILDNFNNKTLQ